MAQQTRITRNSPTTPSRSQPTPRRASSGSPATMDRRAISLFERLDSQQHRLVARFDYSRKQLILATAGNQDPNALVEVILTSADAEALGRWLAAVC